MTPGSPTVLAVTLLVWMPAQQSLVARTTAAVAGVVEADVAVAIVRSVLLAASIAAWFWPKPRILERTALRGLAVAVQTLWPLLLLVDVPVHVAAAAAGVSGALLLFDRIDGHSVAVPLLAMVSVVAHPLGDLISSAHAEFGTCMAHLGTCAVYAALAMAGRTRMRSAIELAAEYALVLGALALLVALFPLCAVGGALPQLWNGADNGAPRLCAADYAVVARLESNVTGWVSVIQWVPQNAMLLRAGHAILGGRYYSTGESIFPDFYLQEAVRFRERDAERPAGDQPRALAIGLGVGTVVGALQDAGWSVDAVEVDAAVAWAARSYFGVRLEAAGGQLFLRDAEAFLFDDDGGAEAGAYDAVIHDVTSGSGAVDRRLVRRQIFARAKRALKINGIIAVNVFGTMETAEPVVRTLQGVFRHVELFGDVFSATNVPAGNFVAFASDAPLRWRARTEEDFGGSDVRKAALADFEARRIPLDHASATHADEESDDEEYRMWELSRQAAAAHARIVEDVWGKDLWRRC